MFLSKSMLLYTPKTLLNMFYGLYIKPDCRGVSFLLKVLEWFFGAVRGLGLQEPQAEMFGEVGGLGGRSLGFPLQHTVAVAT